MSLSIREAERTNERKRKKTEKGEERQVEKCVEPDHKRERKLGIILARLLDFGFLGEQLTRLHNEAGREA